MPVTEPSSTVPPTDLRSEILPARLALIGAALLFSTGGVAIKATSFTSWEVACARSGIAALLLWLAVPAWRRCLEPRALCVGVAYGVTMILFVVANKLTTAVNAIFLQSTAPLYVLVLAPWWLGERTRGRDIALTTVIAAGLVLFFLGDEAPRATAPDPALGNLVAACAGVSWACALTGLRWLARDAPAAGHDPAGAAVVAGNGLACAATLPFVVWLSGGSEGVPMADLAWIAYLGVFQIGLAYLFLTRGVRRVPALEASLLLLLEPVSNGLLTWAVHGEQPGSFALGGSALILAATAARVAMRESRSPALR